MYRRRGIPRPQLSVSRPGLVVPVRVDPTGETGPTPAQVRGPRWRTTSRGLYVPSDVDSDDVQQRIVEAAAVLPSFGGITGWAALAWCGARWFDGLGANGLPRPVVLATGAADIRPQPGIAVSAEGLRPGELVIVDGIRITTLVRSVCFEMRYAHNVRYAVQALDMAAYDDLVSIEEVAAYTAERLTAWTGVPQCREAIGRADENAWSPQEPFMRMLWEMDAGLPRPLCNVPVFDSHGRHVGTPDLIDPAHGVVGEYEGSLHLEGVQRSKDIRREAAFRGVGLEYVTMLAADHHDPRPFLRRLLEAYGRAASVPAERRTWSIVPPPWWTDTSTVAMRRALTGQRRDWLDRRRAA